MTNLWKRVLVGILAIPVLLAVAIHGGWFLAVFVIALQLLALWEWSKACRAVDVKPNIAGIVLALAGLDMYIFHRGQPEGVAAAVFAFSMMLLLDLFRRERRPLRDLSASVLFLGYIALPLAIWTLLRAPLSPPRWEPIGALAVLLIGTWICDSAAYFVGSRFGRHKLDVKASPNKTVEGFLAGLLSAAAALPVLALFSWVRPTGLDYIVFPVIVGIAGQLGDLLESLLKREVQIKDSSAVIPGHGGVLDRFDSLLLSAPLLAAYLLLNPA